MSISVENGVRVCGVGSARIPFVEHGEPVYGQPPLFLFGGKDTKADSWKGLPSALGRHVIAIETPEGNRHPAVPTVWGYARIMGRAVLDLTDEWYGPGVQPDVGGWSLGGMFEQAFALQQPHRVGKSVLMATVPGGITPLLGPFSSENMAAAMAIANPERGAFNPAIYGGAMRHNVELAAEFADLTHRDIDPISSARQLTAALGSGSLYLPTMMGRWQQRARNTLVMLGNDDPVIPYGAAKWLAHCAGMRTHTVEGGGHLFPIDEPEIAGVINEFLDYGRFAA